MNLLPEMRKDALTRMYLLRLAVVGILTLFGVLLVHAVGMLPSFLHIQQLQAVYEADLAGLGEKLAGLEEKTIRARVTTLEARAQELQKTIDGSTASRLLRAVTAVPHLGIKIDHLSFTRGKGDQTPSMIIAGVATSRESLRAYSTTLSLLPYVTKADLPISSFAKETDIPFSITLTGPLTP